MKHCTRKPYTKYDNTVNYEPKLGQQAITANPNKLYRVNLDLVKNVAPSNLPRLCQDDVVVIKREDFGNTFFTRQGQKSFLVEVIKVLSKTKRHNLSRPVVGNVPECILEPFV